MDRGSRRSLRQAVWERGLTFADPLDRGQQEETFSTALAT
jgi:hypothetical protein